MLARTPKSDLTRIDPTDLHVGGRVRVLRKSKRISQAALGAAVGLTFQQIQKYERALNRISASKLHQIAQFLGVSVQYFFDGLESAGDGEGGVRGVQDIRVTPDECIAIARAFPRIRSAEMRRLVLGMVTVMADGEG